MIRYIACCIDAFNRRSAVLVDQYPVFELDAALREKVDDRLDADADDDEIAVEATTALRDHAFGPVAPFDTHHDVVEIVSTP